VAMASVGRRGQFHERVGSAAALPRHRRFAVDLIGLRLGPRAA
jgi:hypothetical protein